MRLSNKEFHMDRFVSIKIELTKEEKTAIKAYAKSKGMTLSGFLSQLIKRELNSDHTASSATIPLTSIRSADGAALYKEGE